MFLAASAFVGTASPAAANVDITATQSPLAVRPGDSNVVLMRVRMSSVSALGATLRSITFTNRTSGPGGVPERDAELGTLRLRRDNGDGTFNPANDPTIGTATAAGGQIRFTGLSVAFSVVTTIDFFLVANLALLARDGDALDASIQAASDVTIQGDVVTGTFPVDPAGSFAVDGMVAAQIAATAVAAGPLVAGTDQNLVLDVTVPANGYASDVLERLELVNLGTAQAGTDIGALRVHVDNGNGQFKATSDRAIGTLASTGGGRWQLTGLGETVPVAGLRLFIAADIPLFPTPNSTIRMEVPTGPAFGFVMRSNNDGPIDHSVQEPGAPLVISTQNRVNLSAVAMAATTAAPGAQGVPILHFRAENAYAASRTLTSVRITNATRGPGTQNELDREFQRVALRIDGNDDGVLGSLAQDPEVGAGLFSSGRVEFTVLSWLLPPGAVRHAFVVADLSTTQAADGDSLSASIGGTLDVTFAETTSLAALWPVDSGARVGVDGMVAAQISLGTTPSITVGPGDGPIAALELVVPPNGYLTDVLQRIRVTNLGTATDADLAGVRLWRDGGDGKFEAAGDDVDLGAMGWTGTSWQSASLSEAVPASGARLWVAVTLAASPTDSATIRLGLPVLALTMASGNDGPLDQAVAGKGSILISNAPLLAQLEVQPGASVVGQSVTARLVLRNRSAETIQAITPTALSFSGAGSLVPRAGPVPASFDLAPAALDTFTWTLDATSPGPVQVSAGAGGTGAPSGLPRNSLPATSPTHVIYAQAPRADVALAQAMPTTVSPGQVGLTPLSVTFTHPGAAGTAPVRIERLIVRVEDATAVGIVPSDAFSRVRVETGSTTLLDRAVESSGSDLDLQLATPATVAAGASVTLVVRLDVSGSASAPNFRLAIAGAASYTAVEDLSGRALTVASPGITYPYRTGLARLVLHATSLDLAAAAGAEVRAACGQADVPLLTLRLDNPGTTGVTSDVRLFAFALQLRDTNGVTLPRLADVLARVRAMNGAQTLAVRTVYPADDSTLQIALSPALNVPANVPIDLAILGDVVAGAPALRFHAVLVDSASVDARDVSSGESVPARFQTHPLAGPRVRIEALADSLRAAGLPRFGARTRIGERGVRAFTATLRHPGASEAGRIRIQSLTILFRDERRLEVAPGSVSTRLALRWQGAEIASATGLPATGGSVVLGLPAPELEAGDTAAVELVVDIAANAPQGFLELTVAGSGIAAVDANTAIPVAIAAEAGAELPISSGLTRLDPPARELRADLEDRMPVALAADGREVIAGVLRLRNAAPAGSDTIYVDSLRVRAASRSHQPVVLGAGASTVDAWLASGRWATWSGQASDSTATLPGATPLAIPPASTVTLELRFRTATPAALAELRLGFDAADVGVRQPGSALLQIEVRPEPGRTLPQWTETARFETASLAGSLSNYPNPFAAGRDLTRFVYFLRADARVTLQVSTIHGETVRLALDHAPRTAGLHDQDAWDGRNGAGIAVRNGVYFAELVAEFVDGKSERIVRKVAVAR